jgi:hypothetical protein
MKIRLLRALVGLVISFAFPTFAQQKVDPKTKQQIRVLASNFDAAFNRHEPPPSLRSTRRTRFMGRRTEHFTVGRPSKKIMQDTLSRATMAPTVSPQSIG